MKKHLGPDIRIDTSNTFALQEQEELKSFQIVAPLQRVVFALGSVDTVGQEADQLGYRRAFLIAGPNTSRTPLYQLLAAAANDVLHDRGLYFNPKRIASAKPILAIYESAW